VAELAAAVAISVLPVAMAPPVPGMSRRHEVQPFVIVVVGHRGRIEIPDGGRMVRRYAEKESECHRRAIVRSRRARPDEKRKRQAAGCN